jgi:hypothetical protein
MSDHEALLPFLLGFIIVGVLACGALAGTAAYLYLESC